MHLQCRQGDYIQLVSLSTQAPNAPYLKVQVGELLYYCALSLNGSGIRFNQYYVKEPAISTPQIEILDYVYVDLRPIERATVSDLIVSSPYGGSGIFYIDNAQVQLKGVPKANVEDVMQVTPGIFNHMCADDAADIVFPQVIKISVVDTMEVS